MLIIRKLIGDTAIYGLSSVFGKALNVVMVPLFTFVFTPEDYGIITELYVYIAFLNIIYTYGFETTFFRFTNKYPQIDCYSITSVSILATTLLFSSFIWWYAGPIATILGHSSKVYLFKWAALILATDALVAIPFAKLRHEGKALKFASFKLVNIGTNLSLNLFFLVVCPQILEHNPNHFIISSIYNPNLGVGYVFFSNLIANGLYFVLIAPILFEIKFSGWHLSTWYKMLHFTWPILIIGVAGIINEMLSRGILKYRLPQNFYPDKTNLEVLGIYGACFKLSVFMNLAIQAFRYAFEPIFFQKSKDKDSFQVFEQVMSAFVMVGSLAWVVISLALPYIAPLFLRRNDYFDALHTVPWLLGGSLFFGILFNLSIWYKLTDKTLYGAIIGLSGALVTLILNWILIPVWGYMGCAIATFISYLCMVLLSYYWGQKHYPISYKISKLILYLLSAGMCIILDQLLPQHIGIKLFLFFLFVLFLLISEKKYIKIVINDRFKINI